MSESESDALYSFVNLCESGHEPVLLFAGKLQPDIQGQPFVSKIQSHILSMDRWVEWRNEFDWQWFLNQGGFLADIANAWIQNGKTTHYWNAQNQDFQHLPPTLFAFINWYLAIEMKEGQMAPWLRQQLNTFTDPEKKQVYEKPSVITLAQLCQNINTNNPPLVLSSTDDVWIEDMNELQKRDLPPFTTDKEFVRYYNNYAQNFESNPHFQNVGKFLDNLLRYKSYIPGPYVSPTTATYEERQRFNVDQKRQEAKRITDAKASYDRLLEERKKKSQRAQAILNELLGTPPTAQERKINERRRSRSRSGSPPGRERSRSPLSSSFLPVSTQQHRRIKTEAKTSNLGLSPIEAQELKAAFENLRRQVESKTGPGPNTGPSKLGGPPPLPPQPGESTLPARFKTQVMEGDIKGQASTEEILKLATAFRDVSRQNLHSNNAYAAFQNWVNALARDPQNPTEKVLELQNMPEFQQSPYKEFLITKLQRMFS